MCFSTSPSVVCSCYYCFYCSADTSCSSDTNRWYPFEICGRWGTEEADIASSRHACPPWYCPSLKHCVVCKDKRIRNKTHSFLLLQLGRSPSLPLCFSPSPAGSHIDAAPASQHISSWSWHQPSPASPQTKPPSSISPCFVLHRSFYFPPVDWNQPYPSATNPFSCVCTLQQCDNCPMRWVLGDAKKCFIRPD